MHDSKDKQDFVKEATTELPSSATSSNPELQENKLAGTNDNHVQVRPLLAAFAAQRFSFRASAYRLHYNGNSLLRVQ